MDILGASGGHFPRSIIAIIWRYSAYRRSLYPAFIKLGNSSFSGVVRCQHSYSLGCDVHPSEESVTRRVHAASATCEKMGQRNRHRLSRMASRISPLRQRRLRWIKRQGVAVGIRGHKGRLPSRLRDHMTVLWPREKVNWGDHARPDASSSQRAPRVHRSAIAR